ncbi:unnamed protein product [Pseudo-nitzschia multistriata]|uniref:HSF-type DNA-binding domain-containing protein n=1 Tax=Pseudo-nitzschia multistriata TaxID=183589 RepID=A0A448ZAQ5_9STRA|nr:unnamed protein product [Pseudo-nitzschia multistriata]
MSDMTDSYESFLSDVHDSAEWARDQFPMKLYNLLEDVEKSNKGLNRYISWLPGGTSFRVHDRSKFEALVLPEYFERMSSFLSFRTQLNKYGIYQSKTTNTHNPDSSKSDGAYSHKYLIRGKQHLCTMIFRRRGNVKPKNDRRKQQTCKVTTAVSVPVATGTGLSNLRMTRDNTTNAKSNGKELKRKPPPSQSQSQSQSSKSSSSSSSLVEESSKTSSPQKDKQQRLPAGNKVKHTIKRCTFKSPSDCPSRGTITGVKKETKCKKLVPIPSPTPSARLNRGRCDRKGSSKKRRLSTGNKAEHKIKSCSITTPSDCPSGGTIAGVNKKETKSNEFVPVPLATTSAPLNRGRCGRQGSSKGAERSGGEGDEEDCLPDVTTLVKKEDLDIDYDDDDDDDDGDDDEEK